jgi:hypothetical protein
MAPVSKDSSIQIETCSSGIFERDVAEAKREWQLFSSSKIKSEMRSADEEKYSYSADLDIPASLATALIVTDLAPPSIAIESAV